MQYFLSTNSVNVVIFTICTYATHIFVHDSVKRLTDLFLSQTILNMKIMKPKQTSHCFKSLEVVLKVSSNCNSIQYTDSQ